MFNAACYFQLVIPRVLGWLLIYAALTKTLSPTEFLTTLYRFPLGNRLVAKIVLTIIITLEFLSGTLLLAGIFLGDIIASFLLSIFSLTAIWVVYTKQEIECNCFGATRLTENLSLKTVIRNILFMILLWIFYVPGQQQFDNDLIFSNIMSLSICLIAITMLELRSNIANLPL